MNELIFSNPWLKTDSGPFPNDVRLVCAYDLHIVVDCIEEAAFFRRTPEADELWIAAGWIEDTVKSIARGDARPNVLMQASTLSIGHVFGAPVDDDEKTSCLRLLGRLFRAYAGSYWPTSFLLAGIIDEQAYHKLIDEIEEELQGNSRKAKETETEIIKVARELRLFPEPTGTGPSFWQARCPERNHPLYINAADNSFGCGWCKRKGGVGELRAFVRERQGNSTTR